MRTKLKTYFPTDSNIPTKYDLHIVKWISRKSLDVSEVIIVIGKDKEGELTQEDKHKIWEIYLSDQMGAPVRVVKASNLSPLAYIYKEQERDTTEPFSIALDKAVSGNEKFMNHFETFPNYEVIVTPAYDKSNLEDIKKILPPELTKEQKKEVVDIATGPDPVDEALSRDFWKTSLGNLLEKAGIK